MNFENLTEIIDFAIEKESEAAGFYEEVSRQESMSGAREMLLEFSQEEKKGIIVLLISVMSSIARLSENSPVPIL